MSRSLPCLILETFCLPSALNPPQEVQRLIAVGSAHHNSGRIVDAVEAFIAAEQSWEQDLACRTLLSLQPSSSDNTVGGGTRSLSAPQQQQQAGPNHGYQRPLTMDDVDAVPILVSLAHQESEQEAAHVAAVTAKRKQTLRRLYELLHEKEQWESQQGPLVGGSEEEGREEEMDDDPRRDGGGASFPISAELRSLMAQSPQLRTTDEVIVELKAAEKQSAETEERHNELVAQRLRSEEKKASNRLHSVLQATQQVPITARVVIQLLIASALQSGANDGRALRSLLHALELCQQAPPSETPGSLILASIYSALGVVYFHLSQYDFAGDYFFRALEIREHLLPPSHADLAAALNNVACVLWVLQRPQDGLVFFHQALRCFAVEGGGEEEWEAAVKDLGSTQRGVCIPENSIRINGACSARCLTIEQNIRLASTSSCDWIPPAVPFPAAPIVPPMIPGARRAKAFFRPKPKKAKVDPKSKK